MVLQFIPKVGDEAEEGGENSFTPFQPQPTTYLHDWFLLKQQTVLKQHKNYSVWTRRTRKNRHRPNEMMLAVMISVRGI